MTKLGSLLASWSNAHDGCRVPRPAATTGEEPCEHCIKGRCLVAWGGYWLGAFLIIITLSFGVWWFIGSEPEVKATEDTHAVEQ